MSRSARLRLATRRTWARLIRKIYEADPLLCPWCGATMKVIAVIEDEEVIYRILAHLHLLAPGDGPPPPPTEVGSGAPASGGPRELIRSTTTSPGPNPLDPFVCHPADGPGKAAICPMACIRE